MKRIILTIVSAFLILSLFGCINDESLELEKETLLSEIDQLEIEKQDVKAEISQAKEENGTAKYVVTFKIKQSHITLDIKEHIKDNMNAIMLDVPVDKEYYDMLSIGDVIDDEFRMGSLIMHGSFGNWVITVENKTIE